ncbi:unnamed protein product [Symbiodinium sp. CCMP2592]|nr:unnamed protein product [Symbiodinium sp. CCMP2592]
MDINKYSDAGRKRAYRLYSILSSYLKGRPLRLLKAVTNRDGLLVWQRLHQELKPSTRSRELALAEALVSFPPLQAGSSLLEYVLVYERLIREYEAVSHTFYPDNLKMSTLLKGLPSDVKRHIQLNLSGDTTYTGLRDKLLQFEKTTASWTTEHVMRGLQLTSSTTSSFGMPFTSDQSGPSPMEIDRLHAESGGKPKGKGAFGGGKYGKGKPYQKGLKGKPFGLQGVPGGFHQKGFKGKGKFGGKKGKLMMSPFYGSGKGKSQQKGKQNKGPKGKGSKGVGPCYACGRMGHVAADCWGTVRQVESGAGTYAPSVAPSDSASQVKPGSTAATASTTASTATGGVATSMARPAQSAGFVRRLQAAGLGDLGECTESEHGDDQQWSDALYDAEWQMQFEADGEQYLDEASWEAYVAEAEWDPYDQASWEAYAEAEWASWPTEPEYGDWVRRLGVSDEESELVSTSCLVYDLTVQDELSDDPDCEAEEPFHEDELCDCEGSFIDNIAVGEANITADQLHHHVRAVGTVELESVIFDSGADVTVLPIDRFAEVGVRTSDNRKPYKLRDAQGNSIPGGSLRARVQFEVETMEGDTVVFEDDAVLAQVAAPLLCSARLFRDGWSLVQGEESMLLSKGERHVPVHFQKNSLAMNMYIRQICDQDELDVRAVLHVGDELVQTVVRGTDGWQLTSDETPVFVSKHSSVTEDPSLSFPCDHWPYRTTLLHIPGRPKPDHFEVFELGAYWEGNERKQISPDGANYTILTLLSTRPVEIQRFGKLVRDSVPAAGIGEELEREKRESERAEAQEALAARDAEQAPMVPPPEVQVDDGRERVSLAGIDVDEASSLGTLRAACKFLDISHHGTKAVLWNRIKQSVTKSRLDAVTQIADAVLKEYERPAEGEPLAKLPSVAEQELHALTHLPRQPWCQACLAARSREDNHTATSPEERAIPVVSVDYMYTGTEGTADERDPLCEHLLVVDMKTKYVLVLPIDVKGGASVRGCTEEIVRMMSSLGCREVHIRADTEPAMNQLVDHITQVRTKLGFKTEREPVPPDASTHQGLPAERYVQTIRQLGNCLLRAIELKCGYQVKSFHPVFTWAFRHAGWLHSRYHVLSSGQTPYELIHGHSFAAKIAPFGCSVFAQCLPKVKAKGATWIKGVYLGRSHSGALNVIGTSEGIQFARTIRRSPTEFEPMLLDAVKGVSWNLTLGVVGVRVPRGGRRIRLPAVVEQAEQAPPEEERDQREQSGPGDEAGSDPTTSSSSSTSKKDVSLDSMSLPGESGSGSSGTGSASGGSRDILAENVGVEEEGSAALESSPKFRKLGEGRVAHVSFMVRRLRDDLYDPSEPIEVPEVSEEHDQVVDPQDDGEFNQVIDEMDTIMLNNYEAGPPELSDEALAQLDAERDQFELDRLVGMGVLVNADEEQLDDDTTELSSKFVRDWRWRDDKWTRRSRLVGREFRSLSPELDDLYSPASISSTTKLLAAMAATSVELELYSLDISDAYLMVPQRTPKYVRANGRVYRILYNLPGQRDGAQGWYEFFSAVLQKHDMKVCEVAPAIFAIPGRLVINTHVDDGKVLAAPGEMEKLREHLELNKLKVKVEGPCRLDSGSCRFLKRAYEGHGDYISVKQEPKYVLKILEVLGYLKGTMDHETRFPATCPGRSFLNEQSGIGDHSSFEVENLLETVSDADFASGDDRKSTTGFCIFLNGIPVYSTSRRQHVIALSSMESELYACLAAVAEGLFLKEVVSFITGKKVELVHRTDASATIGFCKKAGCGRTRHLATSALWIQSKLKDGSFSIRKISGRVNPADLLTKTFSASKMNQLLYHFHVFDSETRLGDEEHAQEIIRRTIFGSTGLKAFRLMLASMLIDRAEGVTVSAVESHGTWMKVAMASMLMLMVLLPMLLILAKNPKLQDKDKEQQRQEHRGFYRHQQASTSTPTTSGNPAVARRRKPDKFPKSQDIQLMPRKPFGDSSMNNTRSSSQQTSMPRIPKSYNNKLMSTQTWFTWEDYQPWMWIWLLVVSFVLLLTTCMCRRLPTIVINIDLWPQRAQSPVANPLLPGDQREPEHLREVQDQRLPHRDAGAQREVPDQRLPHRDAGAQRGVQDQRLLRGQDPHAHYGRDDNNNPGLDGVTQRRLHEWMEQEVLPILQNHTPRCRMDGIDGNMRVHIATHYGRSCHRRDCSSITKDAKATREMSLSQAVERGLAPCHRCLYDIYESLKQQNPNDKMFNIKKKQR